MPLKMKVTGGRHRRNGGAWTQGGQATIQSRDIVDIEDTGIQGDLVFQFSNNPFGGTTSFSEDFESGTIPSGWAGWSFGGPGTTRILDPGVLSNVGNALRVSATSVKVSAHAIVAIPSIPPGNVVRLDLTYSSTGGGIANFGLTGSSTGGPHFLGTAAAPNASGTYSDSIVVPNGIDSIYFSVYDDVTINGTSVTIDSVMVTDMGVATPKILSSPDVFSWTGTGTGITHPVTTDLPATLSIQPGLNASEFTLTTNAQGVQVLSHASWTAGKQVKVRATSQADTNLFSEVTFTSRQRAKLTSSPLMALNYQGFTADNHPWWEVDYSKADVWYIFSIWPAGGGVWGDPWYFWLAGRAAGLDWAQNACAGIRAAGKKSVIVLGGSGLWSTIGQMIAEPAKRVAYATAMIAEAELVGADGFDLDLERTGEFTLAEWSQIVEFVKELRRQMMLTHPTWTLSGDTNGFYNFDWQAAWLPGGLDYRPAFISYLDWCVPMVLGADKYFDSGWKSGLMDPLFGGDYTAGTPVDNHNVLRLFTSMGFHVNKFLLGASTFVDYWGPGITAPAQSLEGKGGNSNDNVQIRYFLDSGGPFALDLPGHTVADHYDAGRKGSWRTISPEVTQDGVSVSYVVYEGAQDFFDKGEYCRRTGCLGVGIWGIHSFIRTKTVEGCTMMYDNIKGTTGTASAGWPV
jgi:hypothetical protein